LRNLSYNRNKVVQLRKGGKEHLIFVLTSLSIWEEKEGFKKFR